MRFTNPMLTRSQNSPSKTIYIISKITTYLNLETVEDSWRSFHSCLYYCNRKDFHFFKNHEGCSSWWSSCHIQLNISAVNFMLTSLINHSYNAIRVHTFKFRELHNPSQFMTLLHIKTTFSKQVHHSSPPSPHFTT